ncbi:aspartate/glutamate racemase family protein [Aquihabitans sp. G128]|uniref:glutamate racemase n=1 Tax=Aquihabitans sp. G128 TaxID=2849779 RepID=UPI001C23642D|nr:aspartate/glutamate racemase family protein [Aquihabitans sp. G128]QXC63117.1 aspartate/glutamate racemase family protein [Aquihabitans sp. G128]
MHGRPAHLGVVDWGIGGLGLLGRLDAAVPGLAVTYWSDTGAAPYGLLGPPALADRLRLVVAALADRGCTEVVLACNAASTAVDRLADAALPVDGIIGAGLAATEAALAALDRPDAGEVLVGVVGGQGTIRSGRYRRGLAAPGRRVRSRVAQPLSAHIEAGRTGSPAFEADLARIVGPLRGAAAVVLACTHYPAAAPSFAAQLPGTVLVDPAAALADELVARHGAAAADRTGARTFVTTGDPAALRRGAARAWSYAVADAARVRA